MLTTEKQLLHATPNGTLSGRLVWSSSDTNVATVEESPDGLECWCIARGPGSASITATEPPRADATPSASGSFSVSVSPPVVVPMATAIEITADQPVPQ